MTTSVQITLNLKRSIWVIIAEYLLLAEKLFNSIHLLSLMSADLLSYMCLNWK